MNRLHVGLAGLGAAAVMTMLAGCGSSGARDPLQGLPPSGELPGFDALVQAFDADLGDEGVPVDRPEFAATLRADAELRSALLTPVDEPFTSGTGE